MLKSYLTLALRTLRRQRVYTAVNALGLTVGLACAALVAVFLEYELTYDGHHENADRIYRILNVSGADAFSTVQFKDFFRTEGDAQRRLAERLPEAIPAIEAATNFEILTGSVFVETAKGNRFASDRRLVTNTGPAFAALFTFERVAGAPLADALARPRSAVLTATTARRYFGDADPIGQPLTVDGTEATVRAVVADPPPNTRLRFDLAMQVERIPNWGAYHYVRLAEGAAPEAVAAQVTALMDELFPRRTEDRGYNETRDTERLQPLTAIHLAERALYDDTPHRAPIYLWAFGAIGLLILGITTINYANLALALYAGRHQEIGVRKALGGHRRQIAGQFLVEAVLLALLCVPLALGVCAAVLPAFNALMETSIAAARLAQPVVLGALVGVAALAGLGAGSYPAFVLARKQAVDLFGRGLGASGGRGWSLRHGLIALQFAVLIGLGSLSWVAYDQLAFMQTGDLGYETEHVVRTNVRADSAAYQQYRQRLVASSAIQAVGMGAAPNLANNTGTFGLVGGDRTFPGRYQRVDTHWFDVMGLDHPVVERMQTQGPTGPPRALVNQAAADRLAPVDPVGRLWSFAPDNPDANTYEIAGVLPNLHLNSMRRAIVPMLFEVFASPPRGYNILVRTTEGRTQAGLAHVRAVTDELFPDTPLQLTFLDDQVAQLYEQERRFMTLAATLSGVAILLAALGLTSLVAYLTRLRMKEIGVRKSLGASVAGLVALLNREYVPIVGAAFLVGAPLAWWAADAWLGQFAYRVGLSPLMFVGAGLGALAVAAVAVSTQAVRAARVNPAQVLRSE
jgi:putative ABC transport system permease protein